MRLHLTTWNPYRVEKSCEIPRAATDMKHRREQSDEQGGSSLTQPDTTGPAEEIFTSSQAAKRLGIPLSTLRNLVRYGSLRATSMENTEAGLRESEIQRFRDRFAESAQIELADPKSIEGSLRTESPEHSPRSWMKNTVYTAPVGQLKKTSRRCRCGSCPTCQDGARWERIFQEKFADPDYYTRRVQRHGSSLSWLS
jgi:hypothetical protein